MSSEREPRPLDGLALREVLIGYEARADSTYYRHLIMPLSLLHYYHRYYNDGDFKFLDYHCKCVRSDDDVPVGLPIAHMIIVCDYGPANWCKKVQVWRRKNPPPPELFNKDGKLPRFTSRLIKNTYHLYNLITSLASENHQHKIRVGYHFERSHCIRASELEFLSRDVFDNGDRFLALGWSVKPPGVSSGWEVYARYDAKYQLERGYTRYCRMFSLANFGSYACQPKSPPKRPKLDEDVRTILGVFL